MLDVQQSTTLVDSFISTVNARVDKLAGSVASPKASLEFTQKDVGDLSSLKSKLVDAENDIVKIKKYCGASGKQNRVPGKPKQREQHQSIGYTRIGWRDLGNG